MQSITINTLGFICDNKEYAPKTFPEDHMCTVKHIESLIGKELFTVESIPGIQDPNRNSVLKNNEKIIRPHGIK